MRLVVFVIVVIVRVAVSMLIQRHCSFGATSEKGAILWRVRDHLWGSFATDMAVQAKNTIRRSHDHMQIMADHYNGAPQFLANLFNSLVKRCRPWLVKTLGRFVQE